MDTSIIEKAKTWLSDYFDKETRDEVQRLINEDPNELNESFYRTLEFGTGGLRGIMGVGTNRMNRYTVGAATQGLANYLKKSLPDTELKVVVSHDSRNNSRFFAEVTARVMAANGILCYLFEDLRPTPELSFAVRHLHCHAGVMVTASHNPKEYNGYTPEALWAMGRIGGYAASPDGQKIVYQVGYYSVKQNKSHQVLYIMNADGSGQQLLTTGSKNETDATWLDKETIAFLTGGEIWTMKADGTDRHQMSQTDGNVEGFKFSPDRQKVIILKSIPFHESIKETPADLPKVICFFADIDCGFSSKYVVIFLEKEVKMFDIKKNKKQKLSLASASSEPIISAESFYCHARR